MALLLLLLLLLLFCFVLFFLFFCLFRFFLFCFWAFFLSICFIGASEAAFKNFLDPLNHYLCCSSSFAAIQYYCLDVRCKQPDFCLHTYFLFYSYFCFVLYLSICLNSFRLPADCFLYFIIRYYKDFVLQENIRLIILIVNRFVSFCIYFYPLLFPHYIISIWWTILCLRRYIPVGR